MSRHLIIEESKLGKLIADGIAEHLKNNGLILASPHYGGPVGMDDDGTAAEIAIAAAAFVKRLGELGLADVVELDPGDKIARMSDVRAAVRSIMAEMRP